jgi:hypothetical protein
MKQGLFEILGGKGSGNKGHGGGRGGPGNPGGSTPTKDKTKKEKRTGGVKVSKEDLGRVGFPTEVYDSRTHRWKKKNRQREYNEWKSLHEKENKRAAKMSPDAKTTLDKLTDYGRNGTVVVQLMAERDNNLIGSRGKVVPTKGLIYKEMQSNECHANTATLWRRKKIDAVVTGFALSDDGGWRSHSWGVKNGKIVETTVKFKKYFGVKLNAAEAKAFAKAESKYERWKPES